MDCVFEAYVRETGNSELKLLVGIREHCHVDMIRRRAAELLWTTAISEVQDLVIVYRADTGQEIFRRAIGATNRIRA